MGAERTIQRPRMLVASVPKLTPSDCSTRVILRSQEYPRCDIFKEGNLSHLVELTCRLLLGSADRGY